MRFLLCALTIVSGSVFSFVTAAGAAEDFTTQCAQFSPPVQGGYCIHKPMDSESSDVVYYFHGLGGNEKYWSQENYYPAQIREVWRHHHAAFPTVISVSFGPVWLLAQKNSSHVSGLFELFTQKVMPLLENQIGGVKGRRLVVGESMGGFNTLQVAMKTHLFDKAAALCAPMSELSPFASQADVDAYVKASAAYAYYLESQPTLVAASVQKSIQLATTFYPKPSDWASADPLELATGFHSVSQFYLAIGFYDQYASYNANLKFAGILKENGVQIELRPQWGGHCAIDIPSLAQFLVR